MPVEIVVVKLGLGLPNSKPMRLSLLNPIERPVVSTVLSANHNNCQGIGNVMIFLSLFFPMILSRL